MRARKRIAVIDDDPQVIELLGPAIEALGYDMDVATAGDDGLALARSRAHVLIILEVRLPRLGGFEICRQLRTESVDTPILFISARVEEANKILGLELGADDYVTKPFSVGEVSARIRALLRRRNGPVGTLQSPELVYGSLAIDVSRHVATLHGKELNLTALEFAVLHYFATQPGKVITRDTLLSDFWGCATSAYDAALTSRIGRLRRKLEDNPDNPRFIKTVYGVGYKFADARENDDPLPE